MALLEQSALAEDDIARPTAIELDNVRPAAARWWIDDQPQEAVKPFGVGAANIAAGAHVLRVEGADGLKLNRQVEVPAGHHAVVSLDPARTNTFEQIRSKVGRVLREEVTGRHIYYYDWGDSAAKPQAFTGEKPVVLPLDSGLSGPDAFVSPRQPKSSKEIFAKLYRKLPAKPSFEECLAAMDYAAKAYHGNARVDAVNRLARQPITPAVSAAAVNALRRRLYIPDAFVDWLVKNGDAAMIAGLPEEEIAQSAPLLRLHVHFAPAERVAAVYRSLTSHQRKIEVLRALDGEPWEKAKPIGQEALEGAKGAFLQEAIECLLQPELLKDPALLEKVKAALGDGSSWKRARERFVALTSRAQAREGSPAALEEIRKSLLDADPKIASAAAIQCVAADEPKAIDVLLGEIPRMSEKARRFLLLHWRDNPFPCSPNRVRVLALLLTLPEEFIYTLAAKQLLTPEYRNDPGARSALETFTRNRPAKAGWQYDAVCRDFEKIKSGGQTPAPGNPSRTKVK